MAGADMGRAAAGIAKVGGTYMGSAAHGVGAVGAFRRRRR